MSNFQKRIIVCGLGSIGRKHVRLLHQQFPQTKIAALRSGKGVSYASEEITLDDQFYSIDEAIKWRPDGAIIASPASCHIQQGLVFAAAGIPLLIEKPLGTGLEDEKDLKYLQKLSASVPILVGYILRYDSTLNWIKAQLNQLMLGSKIIEADFYCGSWLPDWRPDSNYINGVSARRELGGGSLLELSHELDLALWLLSSEITILSAVASRSSLLKLDVEDQVIALAHTNDSTLITFRLNYCSQPPRRRVLVRSNEGELDCDILAQSARLNHSSTASLTFSSSDAPDLRHRLQHKHFFACIDRKELPLCTVSDGLAVLRMVRRIRELANHSC